MDEKTLKFSVNGVNHGLAFEDIKCDDKHGINGYRLAVSLKHRPHKLTLEDTKLYNAQRLSPRPSMNNGAVPPTFGNIVHGRRPSTSSWNDTLSNHSNKVHRTPTVPQSPANSSLGARTPTVPVIEDNGVDSQSVLSPPKKKTKKGVKSKSKSKLKVDSESKSRPKTGSKNKSKSGSKSISKSKSKSKSKTKDKKSSGSTLKPKGHKKSASNLSAGSNASNLSSASSRSKKKKKRKGTATPSVSGD